MLKEEKTQHGQRLCPKWHPIPYIGHYLRPKVAHYIGNMMPFGTDTIKPSGSLQDQLQRRRGRTQILLLASQEEEIESAPLCPSSYSLVNMALRCVQGLFTHLFCSPTFYSFIRSWRHSHHSILLCSEIMHSVSFPSFVQVFIPSLLSPLPHSILTLPVIFPSEKSVLNLCRENGRSE